MTGFMSDEFMNHALDGMFGAWAHEQHTGPALLASPPGDDPTEYAAHLAEIRTRMQTLYGTSETETWSWYAIYACAPATATERVRHLARMLHGDTPETQAEMRAWQRLGDAAPLAYAAGLSVEEATRQVAVGTLPGVAELRAQANWRGWRFPRRSEDEDAEGAVIVADLPHGADLTVRSSDAEQTPPDSR